MAELIVQIQEQNLVFSQPDNPFYHPYAIAIAETVGAPLGRVLATDSFYCILYPGRSVILWPDWTAATAFRAIVRGDARVVPHLLGIDTTSLDVRAFRIDRPEPFANRERPIRNRDIRRRTLMEYPIPHPRVVGRY